MTELGWRQRWLHQAAHNDHLDTDTIHALIRMAVPSLALDEALAVLDKARQLHLAAESLEAQALINGLIEANTKVEEGGGSDHLVQGR